MFKFLKPAALGLVLAAATVSAALALFVDPTRIQPARECSASQNICYMRATINFNDARIGSGVWWNTLPKNAYVMAIDAYVSTAFNAGTTNTLSIGATPTGQDFLATGAVTLGSTGVTHATTAAGLATIATGNQALQTALNGAVPVYVRYAQTGTAATAGAVTVVITYAMANDD